MARTLSCPCQRGREPAPGIGFRKLPSHRRPGAQRCFQ
jgi:hypothetical protein